MKKRKMEIATTIEGESSHFFSKKLKTTREDAKSKTREKTSILLNKKKNTPKVFFPSPKIYRPQRKCALMS